MALRWGFGLALNGCGSSAIGDKDSAIRQGETRSSTGKNSTAPRGGVAASRVRSQRLPVTVAGHYVCAPRGHAMPDRSFISASGLVIKPSTAACSARRPRHSANPQSPLRVALTELSGEYLASVAEGFEFQRISGWVAQEQRGLFPCLSGKPDFRCDQELRPDLL